VSLEHRSPALRAELSTSEIRAEPLWRPLFFQGQTRWPLNCLQLAGCALQSIRLWVSGIAIRGGTSACGPGLRRLDVRAVVRTSMGRGLVPATASSRNLASHYDLALLLPIYHLLSFDSLSAPVQPDYHGLATTDAMALTELQPTLMHLGLLLFTTPMHLGKPPRNPPARRPPPGECGLAPPPLSPQQQVIPSTPLVSLPEPFLDGPGQQDTAATRLVVIGPAVLDRRQGAHTSVVAGSVRLRGSAAAEDGAWSRHACGQSCLGGRRQAGRASRQDSHGRARGLVAAAAAAAAARAAPHLRARTKSRRADSAADRTLYPPALQSSRCLPTSSGSSSARLTPSS
jgi:hypothetical protein